jgi:aryl-alcohol dehydrogenase-like predicted oxidoreductase
MLLETCTLGASGLQASRIGLGLAALGRPGYINLGHADDLADGRDIASMEARAHAVLDAAWSAGVRYFDAARSYGRGEAFLAGWLRAREIDPAAVTVGSKWGYTYTAGWRVDADTHEIKDHSVENLKKQAAESRTLLGPHLDLYQIHSATLESGVLDYADVLRELARLKQSGWGIGLSVSGPRQAEVLKRALDVQVAGQRLFDCVQATWNVLEPSAGETLARAHESGLGVIVKEALANGRLTDRNRNQAFASARRVLDEQAARLETTVDALALAAALACPWVDVVLSGASSGEQLYSNLRALTIRWDAEASSALSSLRESPQEYWATRARLPWT